MAAWQHMRHKGAREAQVRGIGQNSEADSDGWMGNVDFGHGWPCGHERIASWLASWHNIIRVDGPESHRLVDVQGRDGKAHARRSHAIIDRSITRACMMSVSSRPQSTKSRGPLDDDDGRPQATWMYRCCHHSGYAAIRLVVPYFQQSAWPKKT